MTRWWRRWSPWRLRAALADARNWLNDERGIYSGPNALTSAIEVVYRYLGATLHGYRDPLAFAEKARVEGHTLIITANGKAERWPLDPSCSQVVEAVNEVGRLVMKMYGGNLDHPALDHLEAAELALYEVDAQVLSGGPVRRHECDRMWSDDGDNHLVIERCDQEGTEQRGGSLVIPPSWFCPAHAADWDREHVARENEVGR